MTDKEWKEMLVRFGCVVCKKDHSLWSAPTLHHTRYGVGMGQKSDIRKAIPLCPNHHQHGGYGVAFHAGKKAFEANYGSEQDLLAWMLEEILKEEKSDAAHSDIGA